jgi:hypothetical protein
VRIAPQGRAKVERKAVNGAGGRNVISENMNHVLQALCPEL